MAEEIAAGAVVELKSGGPRMTVEWTEEGRAYCQWFQGTKKFDGMFQLTSLRLVPDESGGWGSGRVLRG